MPDSPRRFAVSYFGNRYPHHARQDLPAIAATGADIVVHVMSEADLRWNPATLAELIAIGRESGLQPWLIPWALGGVFGGESASYAVAERVYIDGALVYERGSGQDRLSDFELGQTYREGGQ